MRRSVVLLTSISLGLVCVYAGAGESEYNPNGPSSAQAQAEYLKSLQYFCHADTWDHTAYYFTNVFTVPNPTLDTLAAVDVEWTAYANQTYGKRNIAYPHCEGIGAKDMERTFASFKQTQKQNQPRVPIVELSWHAAGGAAVGQVAGAVAQAVGAVAQPTGATAQQAGGAPQSTGTAAQTPAGGGPDQGGATVEQPIDEAADAATKAADTTEKAVDAADKVQKAATSARDKLRGLLHH
jgi:hypothetical protein